MISASVLKAWKRAKGPLVSVSSSYRLFDLQKAYFTANNKPLHGIRVLDVSRILVGPYCSMYLADFGAEVIKVEPLDGDETRKWGPPFKGSDSTYYLSVNRNKKSIAINLKTDEGLQILYDLVKTSDIFLENFAHGVTSRLKIDYEVLKLLNPRLIYGSVTSYGTEGPYAHKPGFDNIIQSVSGLVHITGSPEQPYKVGVAISDVLTGLNITTGLLAALHARAETGLGQKVETNLLNCSIEALANVASSYLNAGKEAKRWGNHHPSIVPYGIYKVRNDQRITIACGTDRQYQGLCKAIGRMDLAKDPLFITNQNRVANRALLNQELSLEFGRMELKDLMAELEEHRVPCGPINNLQDVFSDEHVEKTGLVEEVESSEHGKLRLVRNPIKFENKVHESSSSPPKLGEHTDEILSKLLNKSAEEISALQEKKVVK